MLELLPLWVNKVNPIHTRRLKPKKDLEMSQQKNLTPVEIKKMLDEKSIVLVDVREADENASERIEGAVLMPLSTFNPQSLPKVAAGQSIVFHCAGGVRSAKAVAKCQQAGVDASAHMEGGI
jgi:rhodanese-related sulfurtransferase